MPLRILDRLISHSWDRDYLGRGFLYVLCIYPLYLCLAGHYVLLSEGTGGWAKNLYLATSLFGMSALYLLPMILLFLLGWRCRKAGWRCIWIGAAALVASWTAILLGIDVALLSRFGFHINGLVVNLLFTRGGIEAMGLDAYTFLPLGVLFTGVTAILLVLAYLIFFMDGPGKVVRRFLGRRLLVSLCAVALGCLLCSIAVAAYSDFTSNGSILSNVNLFPLTPRIRMRHVLKCLGLKQVKRKMIPQLGQKRHERKQVLYPLRPIQRDLNHRKYNIIWVNVESLRWDMLKPAIMPETCRYAEKSIVLEQHYSGGNGTRPAVFSMFYGLYGLNWDNFLNARREPLFFDWLVEDGYQLLCQTSSEFNYPEIDQTCFLTIPNHLMVEHKQGDAAQRDRAMTELLLHVLDNVTGDRPFFQFLFYESTHSPYTFPKEHAIERDYIEKINFATVNASDAPKIYHRYVNAAHYIDGLLGRLYACLEAHPSLAENTIVLITGDHGEEFYEHGRLGHNSSYVEQQCRTLTLLHIPGVEPRRVTHLTHHTDLIPTLAPYLGVKNSPRDYCLGQDILGDYARKGFLVCGWEQGAWVNDKLKCVLPLGKKGWILRHAVTHRDDRPLSEDERRILEEEGNQGLELLQNELIRFTN